MNHIISYTSSIKSAIRSAISSEDEQIEVPFNNSTNELVEVPFNNSTNTLVEVPFDNSTNSFTYTCDFFDVCKNIFSNQYVDSINCNCLCENKPHLKSELEELLDDNDNEIIFITDDSINNTFKYIPSIFYSESTFKSNRIFSCTKISTNGDIISLIFKNDNNNNRLLLSGFMYKNNEKYNISEFNAEPKIKINNIIYENIAVCKISKY